MKTNQFIKAAVIGDPIHHSLSPKLHNFWLNKYGINGKYEAKHTKSEDLEKTIKSMIEEGYAGFNVTLPHKEKVFNFIVKEYGEVTRAAFSSKAVNTITIKEDKTLLGHNSDAEGFLNNIKYNNSDFSFTNKNAFLIGAGGAARAIIYSLIENAKVKNIFITNRSKEKFDLIYQELLERKNYFKIFQTKLFFLNQFEFEKKLDECDILINSTSLGMINQPLLNLDLKNLKNSAIVYDIVYKPLITQLLKNAQSRNNKIITGLGMLAFQGAVGFEEWFNCKPKIDEELLNFLTTESQK